jgi:nucleoside-diphosphate-sugar epimerase
LVDGAVARNRREIELRWSIAAVTSTMHRGYVSLLQGGRAHRARPDRPCLGRYAACRMKKLFVTGAAGFIGRHLLSQLVAAGHSVTALQPLHEPMVAYPPVAGRLRWVRADLFDARALEAVLQGQEAIVHLAGRFPRLGEQHRAEELAHANVVGMHALLQACDRAGVLHVVHASSAHVYGAGQGAALHEDGPLDGGTPYAISKRAAEDLLCAWALAPGRSGWNLRLFNVYGPGQSGSNVVSAIARQVLRTNQVSVYCAWPQRDFVFVDDVAAAFAMAAVLRPADAPSVNIGSGAGMTVGALARQMLRLAGHLDGTVAEHAAIPPSAANPASIVADVVRAQLLLGWRPATPLVRGLTATLDWMRGGADAASIGR